MRTVIRLRDRARVCTGDDGVTRLVSPSGGQSFGVLTAGQRRVLGAVAAEDCDEHALLVAAANELPFAYALLALLHKGNWLAVTLLRDGQPVLTVDPLGGPPTSAADVLGAALAGGHRPGTQVLSRFALVRQDRSHWVVESPRCGFAVHLRDPALLRLDDPAVVAVLAECGLVVPELSEEDTRWSPHELWFHARTRQGRHDLPWGATHRFEPPPAHRERWPGPVLPLSRPDPAAVAARDPRLAEVMEARRSLREHDDSAPLTAAQLGEFLHRVARTKSTTKRRQPCPKPRTAPNLRSSTSPRPNWRRWPAAPRRSACTTTCTSCRTSDHPQVVEPVRLVEVQANGLDADRGPILSKIGLNLVNRR